MKKKTYELSIGDKKVVAEFTDLAENADGAVLVRSGETAVFATAVMGSERDGIDYFPLSVEFEERFYAAGQILGSRFVRREGRPSDEAVLSARIIDRTIRPLFPDSLRNEVQVIITILAMGDEDPDVLGVLAASLALSTSRIPWGGPVGCVRIGIKENGEHILNPTYDEQSALIGSVFACGRDNTINMIEVGAREISEDALASALDTATGAHAELVSFQETVVSEIGKGKVPVATTAIPEDVRSVFEESISSRLPDAVFCNEANKSKTNDLKDEWKRTAKELLPESKTADIDRIFENAVERIMDEGILQRRTRPDGRALDELRPLYAQAGGISPILHGSGIFYRGGTHIFSALTLGGPQDSQIIDTMEERETKKRFIHHYNFPPFSVGETGRVGGFNRRMIGHGALAEKALEPVIPPKETFPYTIRLVSETMSSNGSSSMGSVCASTLALMDGGVPISRPVAGIASGVIYKSPTEYALLTDIQGPEDMYGDMDFKVAGTSEGITAVQMDVKVSGIPVPILREALDAAKMARLAILETMQSEISEPRHEISPRAPKIVVFSIPRAKIGLVIGAGGKTINKIKEETGVEEIALEDDGTVFITGTLDTAQVARARVEALTHEFLPGEKIKGRITKIAAFGAFVELNEYTEGLLHISEIAPFRIDKVEDVLTMGEEVSVVVKSAEDGKVSLSIKMLDPDFATRKGVRQSTHPHTDNGRQNNSRT